MELSNVRELTILEINLSMTKHMTFKASPSNCQSSTQLYTIVSYPKFTSKSREDNKIT